MHRLIVAFLAAFDAVIAAAVGIAATLAPLTLLWIFGFGDAAPWGTLWPASVSIWQLGNLVPLHVRLPDEYLAATGIGADAASFVLSLAPLAFATFTAVFAARSGARASRADAWVTGVVVGTLVFGALTALAGVTARNPVAAVHLWQAVLFPTLLFAAPALVGALVTEWREAGAGIVARMRDRVEAARGGWGVVPGLVVRGSAAALAGLIGAGALAISVSVLLGGGAVIALFEAGNLDLVGVIVVALGQLAYVPTFVVWGLSFLAGPGFAVGVGTAVSPAGTELGVVPAVPILGALPGSTSPWLLLVVLVPIAVGALAGWIARSHFVSGVAARHDHEPLAPRLVLSAGIAVLTAAVAALLAFVASGSAGPGRLAETGPEPGPVALAVGLEVLVGAAILLLSPRREARTADLAALGADAEPAVGIEAPLEPSPEGAVATDAAAPGIRAVPPPLPDLPRAPSVQPSGEAAAPDTGAAGSARFGEAASAAGAEPASGAAPAAREPDAITAPIELPAADHQEPPVD